MLSKSSSLRSQQTTTKELIPSITASANTLATQHQHGTQEPHWQILAAFSVNSELRWSFPSKRGSDKYWNWIGFQEEKWRVRGLSTARMRFLTGNLRCSLNFLPRTVLLEVQRRRFYFESHPSVGYHTCRTPGELNQSHSLKSMIQQLYWTWWEREHVGTDSWGPSSHLSSLFHITHACSCFCVSTNCTWELWIFVDFVHRRCLNHIQTLSCLSASVIKNSVWWKYYRNVSEGVMGVMFLLKFAV